MNMVKLFPTILIILDIGAAIVYLLYGEYGKALYWASAGLITFSTLLM